MDYEGYTFVFFFQNINKNFLITRWYILRFYLSTIENYFLNASNIYLIKLKSIHTFLPPFNMNNIKIFNIVYQIKKDKTEKRYGGSSLNGIFSIQ